MGVFLVHLGGFFGTFWGFFWYKVVVFRQAPKDKGHPPPVLDNPAPAHQQKTRRRMEVFVYLTTRHIASLLELFQGANPPPKKHGTKMAKNVITTAIYTFWKGRGLVVCSVYSWMYSPLLIAHEGPTNMRPFLNFVVATGVHQRFGTAGNPSPVPETPTWCGFFPPIYLTKAGIANLESRLRLPTIDALSLAYLHMARKCKTNPLLHQ